jgi:molybdopterin-guanine dinucleotide biosynthesis protein A
MNAYILIGGRSARMGASKVGMFLDRVLTAAAPVFDEVMAVQRFGGDAAPIRTIFEDPHELQAPVFGLVRALRDAGDRAFILAVDYPLITDAILRYLRDEQRVPIWDGRPQPLCAVWDAAALPRIEERIARGVLDLRGLIDREMIQEAELRARFAGEPLRNVNTPAEWEAVRSHG